MFAEPTVEAETRQVTTFLEAGPVEPVTEGSSAVLSSVDDAAELLPEALVNVLERPIRVTTVRLTASDTQSKRVAAFSVFKTWLAAPHVSKYASIYQYARSDFTIRIQANAQPFTSGMLLGVVWPWFRGESRGPSCRRHISGLSGMRSVRMNINEETAVSIDADWCAPTSHMAIPADGNAPEAEFMQFELYVYAPLAGPTDVDITIWLEPRNTQLSVPRGADLTPTGPAQSAEVEEQSFLQKGVAAVRAVADTIKPWWETFTTITAILGLSKPRLTAPTMRMQPNVMDDMGTGDGVSAPKMLAMFKDNAIKGTGIKRLDDEDPMVISNIIKRPCFFDQFPWDVADAEDRLLWTGVVSPQSTPRDGRGWLSWIAMMFELWRGSITYRFHFVKTKFHTGRVEIAFVPHAVVDGSQRDHTNTFRTIIDLRHGSTFDITIPYVFPAAFATGPIGTITARVVNDLRAPDTVSSVVLVLVENFSRDMVFQIPSEYPARDMASVINPSERDGPAQLCDDAIVKVDLVPASKRQHIQASSEAIGEMVTDLRQLLKRYGRVGGLANGGTICPYAFGNRGLGARLVDWLSHIAGAYGFFAGSVRIMTTGGGPCRYEQVSSPRGNQYPPTLLADGKSQFKNGAAVVLKTSIEPIVELQIPPYAATPFMRNTAYGFRQTDILNGIANPVSCINIDPLTEEALSQDVWRSIAEDFAFGFLLGPTQPV